MMRPLRCFLLLMVQLLEEPFLSLLKFVPVELIGSVKLLPGSPAARNSKTPQMSPFGLPRPRVLTIGLSQLSSVFYFASYSFI